MRRIWFWKPALYWHGWRTLLPVFVGNDIYWDRTLVLGWTVTGRVVIGISRYRLPADIGDYLIEGEY